jgi:peptidyl-prolyl cis-trans isomerase A (cyclophilin A)
MRPPSLLLLVLLAAVVAGCGGKSGSSTAPPKALLDPSTLTAKAPQLFDVTFKTTAGTFDVTVHRTWSPHGADRFYNLVKNGFFDGTRFFRVLPGFIVQFGLNGNPAVSARWHTASIPDDPVAQHNARGTITFATAGPNTRTTQLFINFGDNVNLDGQGFAPFGKVVDGMSVVDRIYSGYGERPDQGLIESQGNAYLASRFPRLDSIAKATIVP